LTAGSTAASSRACLVLDVVDDEAERVRAGERRPGKHHLAAVAELKQVGEVIADRLAFLRESPPRASRDESA
jgi:hypothetical protein